MSKPTHKQLQDTLAAINRGGEPLNYVQAVSVADYQATLLTVEYYQRWVEKLLENSAELPDYRGLVTQVADDLRDSANKSGDNLHDLTEKFCDTFYDDVMDILGWPT
jgi:chemotaxis regulatin CheY-phosphate phosphatase CheZ